MAIKQVTFSSHVKVKGESFSWVRAISVAFDHGVVHERVGEVNGVEEELCLLYVGRWVWW